MKKTLLLVLVVASGCAQTTITVLTQVPPGRVAILDVDKKTLTVTKGLAVALECTGYDESYGSRPCGQLVVAPGDATLADILPVHLDALAGNTVSSTNTSGDLSTSTTLNGPSNRSGVVLAAKGEGTTQLDITSDSPPVSLTLVVVPAPGADPAPPSGG